jgi:hypothetical protein
MKIFSSALTAIGQKMNLSRHVRNFAPSSSTSCNKSVNEHIDKYSSYRHQFWNFLIQWQFVIYHSVSGSTIVANITCLNYSLVRKLPRPNTKCAARTTLFFAKNKIRETEMLNI